MKDETDGNGFLKWDACSAGRDAKGHGYLDTKAAHAIQAAREDVEVAALRAPRTSIDSRASAPTRSPASGSEWASSTLIRSRTRRP